MICTRNVATVDRPLYKHYIIDHFIPAIKAEWPAQDRVRTILIQKYNATPHVLPSDPDVVVAGTADGWNIRLLFQPPNSPDLNVLDLGFFASIQSIQYRQETREIDEHTLAKAQRSHGQRDGQHSKLQVPRFERGHDISDPSELRKTALATIGRNGHSKGQHSQADEGHHVELKDAVVVQDEREETAMLVERLAVFAG